MNSDDKPENKCTINSESTFDKSSIPIRESPFLKSPTSSNPTITQEEIPEERLGEVKFQGPCKLFRMSTKTNRLEQRGVGVIYICRTDENTMYRVVMVRDKIMKLGCNHYIEAWSDIRPHKTAENTWVWCTTCDKCDDVASEPNQTYVVKFKNNELSEKFKNEFEAALRKNNEYLNKKKTEKK
ncbi:Ran-specific GTPase-activating protein 1 [Astathelohania contejeani]|uniref:Ran-specific GTPase-activating protein 1 n=1 Tax=Astathelohania contejeani TaxID=164912 RepID=A0ABQ7HWR2_9MICR|nr:Ran-specific GTPase-activating protein 1 [Thelohania contejeani]